MKIENCLICGCHYDNRKYNKCSAKRHCFSITEKQAKKYDWCIEYIKEELKTGRHIVACLGSAGLIFEDDINLFKNYCYQKDKYLYDKLNENKNIEN